MNIQKNTRGLVESAIITAVICVLGIAGMYIPFLGILLFIVPAPLIVLAKRYGLKFSIMSLVASSLVMMSFSSPVTALFIITFPGVTALVIGHMMCKKYQPVYILASGTMISIGVTALSLFIASKVMGVSLIDNIQAMLDQSADIQKYMFSISGADENAISEAKEMIQMMNEMVTIIIPSAIILTAFFSTYLNYIIAVAILRRSGNMVESLPPFRYFKLSRNALQGIFVITALSLLVSYFNIVDKQSLMTNVFILFQLIFMIQGAAVVAYYLHFYKVKRPFKIITFVFLIISRIGAMALLIVGLIDIIMNLRKYKGENGSKF